MSGQFVTGSSAQNSQTHPPCPAGLKVGSSTLSGSNNAKLLSYSQKVLLSGLDRGEALPGTRKPGRDRRVVLPRPLSTLPQGAAHFGG